MDSYEKALARLAEMISHRGVARLERALGWSANTFHKARQRATGLRLREVTEILDCLRESMVLGPCESRPSAPAEFMARGAVLAKKHPKLLPPLREQQAEDRGMQAELEALDDLRLHDPTAAAQLARTMAFKAARDGRAGDAAHLLARQAAAVRLNLDPESAHVCLWWGLRHLPDEPDLWLRASYVQAQYGDFEGAWELAGLALSGFARLGDLGGMGRCISDQARYLYYLDEFDKALQGYESALKILPPELKRQRWATHQCLGLLLLAMGRLDEAADQAARAAEVENAPGIHGGQLLWLQARIARGRRFAAEAEAFYYRAIEELEPSPNNAALATCELVQFLLEEGKITEAVGVAKTTGRFIQYSGNRIVNAALVDLASAALQGAGKLTVAFVQRTMARIEKANRPSARPSKGK